MPGAVDASAHALSGLWPAFDARLEDAWTVQLKEQALCPDAPRADRDGTCTEEDADRNGACAKEHASTARVKVQAPCAGGAGATCGDGCAWLRDEMSLPAFARLQVLQLPNLTPASRHGKSCRQYPPAGAWSSVVRVPHSSRLLRNGHRYSVWCSAHVQVQQLRLPNRAGPPMATSYI